MKRFAFSMLRGAAPNGDMPSGAAMSLACEAAYWLVRAFYLCLAIICFDNVRRLYKRVQSDDVIEPLWPVYWVNWVDADLAGAAIAVFLLGALIAVLAFPGQRWARIAVAVGLLQYSGYANSFGSINHYAHYPLWMAVIFCFAPLQRARANAGLSERMLYLLPFFSAQVVVGLFYSLSGFYKLWFGLFPPFGNVSSFHPLALPLHVMGRWEKTGLEPLLGSFFADNIWIAWPAFLAVIYFELTFIIAVFRPQIHRIFGIALAVFHLGVWLVMGISFPYQTAMVALLFIASPFAAFERGDLRQMLLQMPGIGLLWRLFARQGRAPIRALARS